MFGFQQGDSALPEAAGGPKTEGSANVGLKSALTGGHDNTSGDWVQTVALRDGDPRSGSSQAMTVSMQPTPG